VDLEFPDPPTPFAPAERGSRVAYRGGRLFDGTGAPVRDATTILVGGDTIVAVVDDDSDVVPAGVRVVDLDGRYVIPGLIDSHQHLATPPNRPVAEVALRRQVYGGVTTVRDMADDLRQLADLARASRVGEIAGPDIRYAALMAGPGFFADPRTWQVCRGETPGTVPWMQAITADTDLPLAVALARGTGAAAIKVYADLPGALVAAISREAHRQGTAVWAHAAVFPARPADVVAAGVDVVSHVTMLGYEALADAPGSYEDKPPLDRAGVRVDDPRVQAVLAEMARRGTVLDATASLSGRIGAAGDSELAARLTARAHQAGVAVSTGTDYETGLADPWPALHEELRFLAGHCAMSPAEVIRSATLVGARSAGAEASMGSVEPGKLANLVVLAADPTRDVANLAGIEFVLKRGRCFPRTEFEVDERG
jgi:imidazolonepropionase-like amidohydrolase